MLTQDATKTGPVFNSQEWQIIGMTSLGHSICHVGELAYPGVILAVMAEFGISQSLAASIAVPCFVLYGVGAIPAGLCTDRRGAREMLTVFFFLVALACATIVAAQSVCGLAVGLTLLGASISIYHPAGLAMLSHGCRARGRAMGLNGVAGSLGVALGPALGIFCSMYFGWRVTYGIIATLALIGGVISVSLPLRTFSVQTAPSASRVQTTGSGHRMGLIFLFVAMLLGGFNYRCLTTALPAYLGSEQSNHRGSDRISLAPLDSTPAASVLSEDVHDDRIVSNQPAKAWGTVFMVLALGGVGQFWGGSLADKFCPAKMYTMLILATVPFAIMMALTGTTFVVLAASLLAVFMFSQQPLENTMIAEATPRHLRSTAYGLKFILSFGVASLGTSVAGLVWEYYGLSHVFLLFAMNALLMAIAAAGYWKYRQTTV